MIPDWHTNGMTMDSPLKKPWFECPAHRAKKIFVCQRQCLFSSFYQPEKDRHCTKFSLVLQAIDFGIENSKHACNSNWVFKRQYLKKADVLESSIASRIKTG